MKDCYLVVCCGYWQRYIIRKAKEMGYVVIGIDGIDNPIGKSECNIFIQADIRNPHECLMKIKEYDIKGCITSNDLAQRTIGLINDYFLLPGISYADALLSIDKLAMKSLIRNHKSDYPDLVSDGVRKPIDGSGSVGVELSDRTKYGYFIERKIEGIEHTVDGFVDVDGQAYILGYSDKYKFKHFQVSTKIEHRPFEEVEKKKVSLLIGNILSMFRSTSYPFHAEIIETADGHYYLIEIATRMASGIGTHIIPWISGSDYLGDMIRLSCGQKIGERRMDTNKYSCFYFFTPEGIVKEIIPPKNTDEWFIKCRIGDRIEPPTADGNRVGHAIYYANSKDELEKKMKEVSDVIITE